MTSKVALASIGLVSTGAVGTGLYYSGALSSGKETLASLVNKDDYTMVMKEGDSSWNGKWDSYRSSSNFFGIKDASLEKLKGKCFELMKTGKVSNKEDPTYVNFLQFCTRDKTTKEKLYSLGKSILSKDNQDTEWKKRFNEYKKDGSKNRLSGISAQSSENESQFTKLSEGCNNLSDKAWREAENAFDSIKEWCLSGERTQ
ncbi:hypothetical protein MHC_01675 [Mycoplasma haemocanis str. Illinois]|uniref:Uncharacterized protein n=1 Tax=Mycoplasma haemocanis (strain Illinois) TaxID=1111676 RepID=H6N6C9_MYCHN|nr:hypothetical protein [Mycoplasma haemocanis]AEW45201.1 hypothetical protein MHC_01675 [Mycoplasma haemocanis str. Illinois]